KDTITFEKDGKRLTSEYVHDGKDIWKYETGNRDVRYTFKITDDNKAVPKLVQFSDHNIAPKKSAHFHNFMGHEQQKALKKFHNSPTYHQQIISEEEIKEEMLAH